MKHQIPAEWHWLAHSRSTAHDRMKRNNYKLENEKFVTCRNQLCIHWNQEVPCVRRDFTLLSPSHSVTRPVVQSESFNIRCWLRQARRGWRCWASAGWRTWSGARRGTGRADELKVVEMNLLTGTAVLAQEGVRLIDSKQLAPNQRPDDPVTVQQEGKKGSANMQCWKHVACPDEQQVHAEFLVAYNRDFKATEGWRPWWASLWASSTCRTIGASP